MAACSSMAADSKRIDCVPRVSKPRPMQKVNSETNLAVSLLLAVGNSQLDKPLSPRQCVSVEDSRSELSIEEITDSSAGSTQHSQSPQISDRMLPPQPGMKNTPISSSGYSSTSRSRTANGHCDGELFRYTYEERQSALQRFREKKRRRQFQKRVRYMVRKRLAETRPRYKGRFSKPPAEGQHDSSTTKDKSVDSDKATSMPSAGKAETTPNK